MAIVVVGGHSRNVGKTSVVAGLIASLPQFQWGAVKVTQYGHGICSRSGKQCQCASEDHTWTMSEKRERDGNSDTSRFLQAGAAQVWWVRTEQGRLSDAMPAIRERLRHHANVIFESNSMMQFIRPDLYLSVLDPAVADFKVSARSFLNQADAYLLHGRQEPKWNGIVLREVPRFYIQPPEYITPEIVSFVEQKLSAGQTQSQMQSAIF